jgi:hypothetical protein
LLQYVYIQKDSQQQKFYKTIMYIKRGIIYNASNRSFLQ